MDHFRGRVVMSGIHQAVLSTFVSSELLIGDAYEGGFYAGQISTAGNGVADYNLVVGPSSSAESFLAWKTSQTATAGTDSVIDGPTNSGNMNNSLHPAGQFCEGLTIGGFSDWYMPAKDELDVCYFNLKPSTASNSTSAGINAYAVPARASNYTTGTPAQTSAAIFQSGGSEAYDTVGYPQNTGIYWSSTQRVPTHSFAQYFSSGYYGGQYRFSKHNQYAVRAIRRVAI